MTIQQAMQFHPLHDARFIGIVDTLKENGQRLTASYLVRLVTSAAFHYVDNTKRFLEVSPNKKYQYKI
jgi:hypothetical protein